MLAKFLRFTGYIKPDDQITLKVACQNEVLKDKKLLECNCKNKSLQVRISTDCAKFKHDICICCKKQYEFMMEHLCVQPQHLMIELTLKKLDKLLLLNDREWNHILIHGNTSGNDAKTIFEYLPKMRYLSWENYQHVESLKSAFYLLQNNQHLEFVRFYTCDSEILREQLEIIGVEIPDLNAEDCYMVYIQKDRIYVQEDNQEMLDSEGDALTDFEIRETDIQMPKSNLVCVVPYDYEDLNL